VDLTPPDDDITPEDSGSESPTPESEAPSPSEFTIGGFRVDIEDNKLIITPVETIPVNTEVSIYIDGLRATDGSTIGNIDFFYTTAYYPVFTTPTQIRLTEGLGSWIMDVPDDTIWRTILKNTIRCARLWNDGRGGLNYKRPAWCAVDFVHYATVLDLMDHYIQQLMMLSGSKRLADLDIDYRGPSSFQSVISNLRAHIVEKVEDLEYHVRHGCTFRHATGYLGSNYWEPKPIINYNITWKRYPAVKRVNPVWARMYPYSHYHRNLENMGEAYDRGIWNVPRTHDGDFFTPYTKRRR